MQRKIRLSLMVWLAFPVFVFAQNANKAAVDTLVKEVAIAVFTHINQSQNQTKAQLIYSKLLDCGDDCDPQSIIKEVGGWDAVGSTLQELGELKGIAPFLGMSSADANTAIRKKLAQFYATHKSNNNYGKPLTPAVQSQILAKIDRILPPAPAAEQTPVTTKTAEGSTSVTDEGTGIDPTALKLSQLERAQKEKQDNQLWIMILSAIAGLVVGAAGVYLLLYRAAKSEIAQLKNDINSLSRDLDYARKNKPANEPRQPQGGHELKARGYDAILEELGTSNPLEAIRQLKQQVASSPRPIAKPRSGEPTLESALIGESGPIQVQQPLKPLPPMEPLPPIARSEVFYCPPPDPNGQFDVSQKSETLSPESAYRFSVNASNPSVATFRFEAEPGRVARFLTYRNYMIEPACDSENSYSSTYTRITMRRDGEAVLENGIWRVKNKALIRYE